MGSIETLQLAFPFESDINVKPAPKAIDSLVNDYLDCFISPVIVFECSWKDGIPKDMLNAVTTERLIHLMKDLPYATKTEVAIYMMPRTFEGPLSRDWVDIYTHCSSDFLKFHRTQEYDLKDLAPETLSDYQNQMLRNLQHWIYKKRREALKQKLKNHALTKR
jgi:hypothetical protein